MFCEVRHTKTIFQNNLSEQFSVSSDRHNANHAPFTQMKIRTYGLRALLQLIYVLLYFVYF